MAAFAVSVLWLLFFVAVVGAAVWAIQTFVPMHPDVRRIFDVLVKVVCVIVVLLIAYWLLTWLTTLLAGGHPPVLPRP